LIAAAPDMPFRDQAFSFIFDGGCMNTLPTSEWPRYFEQVERMLRPAGLFQLYASEAAFAEEAPGPDQRAQAPQRIGGRPGNPVQAALARAARHPALPVGGDGATPAAGLFPVP
jgi:hypothetical protein